MRGARASRNAGGLEPVSPRLTVPEGAVVRAGGTDLQERLRSIASVGGAKAAVIVTEPTVSGAHDLERALELESTYAPAVVGLALARLAQNRHQDAVEVLLPLFASWINRMDLSRPTVIGITTPGKSTLFRSGRIANSSGNSWLIRIVPTRSNA